MKIICFGDSLTYGFGVPKELRWSEKLKKSLNVNIFNKGINGDTTSGMLVRSYNDIILKKPDIAIIMGGTNDFLKGYSCEYVFENICEIVNECTKYNIEPIIGIQIPVFESKAAIMWDSHIDYNKVNEKLKKLRKMIINYCLNEKIKYIDFFNIFNNMDFKCVESYYLDGIHLNEKGHDLMSKKAIDVIKGDKSE